MKCTRPAGVRRGLAEKDCLPRSSNRRRRRPPECDAVGLRGRRDVHLGGFGSSTITGPGVGAGEAAPGIPR